MDMSADFPRWLPPVTTSTPFIAKSTERYIGFAPFFFGQSNTRAIFAFISHPQIQKGKGLRHPDYGKPTPETGGSAKLNADFRAPAIKRKQLLAR
jgi:hypothetical protein